MSPLGFFAIRHLFTIRFSSSRTRNLWTTCHLTSTPLTLNVSSRSCTVCWTCWTRCFFSWTSCGRRGWWFWCGFPRRRRDHRCLLLLPTRPWQRLGNLHHLISILARSQFTSREYELLRNIMLVLNQESWPYLVLPTHPVLNRFNLLWRLASKALMQVANSSPISRTSSCRKSSTASSSSKLAPRHVFQRWGPYFETR